MKWTYRSANFRTDEQGFTATELVVVLAIIGILVAVAIPSFSSLIPNYRLKAAARTIYSDMQKARLQAIKGNTYVTLLFKTVTYPAVGGEYDVFIDDGASGGTAANGSKEGGEKLLWSIPMDENTSLVKAGFGSVSYITFTPKGVTNGSQFGSVQIRNKQRWYKLTIYAGGGMKLENSSDGTDGSWK